MRSPGHVYSWCGCRDGEAGRLPGARGAGLPGMAARTSASSFPPGLTEATAGPGEAASPTRHLRATRSTGWSSRRRDSRPSG
jgi:hypothetical protein